MTLWGRSRAMIVPLHFSLRHEVARLIVWHVVTRPVVPSAVSYADVREGHDSYRACGHDNPRLSLLGKDKRISVLGKSHGGRRAVHARAHGPCCIGRERLTDVVDV